MRARLVRQFSLRNTLGEGAVWDERNQTLYWTDIESKLLWRWHFDSDEPESVGLPARLASFALTPRVGHFVGAFEHGFALFDLSGSLDLLVEIDLNNPATRMNDGRVDRQGRFWAGSMAEKEPETGQSRGALWRLDGRGAATQFLQDICISNSLCWSKDGRRMYFADSPKCQIETFEFDDGPSAGGKFFASTADEVHPDGSTIDSDDCLWNAEWGAGRLTRYRPEGAVDYQLALPVSQPTCMAFGGPELSHLFVTSAADGLTHGDEGSLLVYETDFAGLPEQICTTPLGD